MKNGAFLCTMSRTVLELLTTRHTKEEMLAVTQRTPKAKPQLVGMLHRVDDVGWRAAWLLGHLMEKDDLAVKPHVTNLIELLPGKKDGHQRELLKVLDKMDLNDDQEGHLFNYCMDIWEEVGKSPSVRYVAFKTMIAIAVHYPELKKELRDLLDPQYVDALSPGIRRSLEKNFRSLLS